MKKRFLVLATMVILQSMLSGCSAQYLWYGFLQSLIHENCHKLPMEAYNNCMDQAGMPTDIGFGFHPK